MLYTVIKRLIERGQTDRLREKINVFYTVGSLTEAQYNELAALLDPAA